MNEEELKKKIIRMLGEHIGTESKEIGMDDALLNDLHMNASGVSDFVKKLEEELSIDLGKFDLSKAMLVKEIVEAVVDEAI